MAAPTNINTGQTRGPDPTNINVGPRGTHFTLGITGADQPITLGIFGTNRPTGDTAFIADSWTATTDGYFRKGNYLAAAVTATATFDIFNATTAASIVAAVTPVAATAGAITFASTAVQSFSEGDVIQVRSTTSGAGVLGGLAVHLWYTETAGSTTNAL